MYLSAYQHQDKRHTTAYNRLGFPGLLDELELDVARLGKRNLGRDDRVISHWGREVRFPFLDEKVVMWALRAPVVEKCGFGEEKEGEARVEEAGSEDDAASQGLTPEKKVLRCLAWRLGMRGVAREKKRAVSCLGTTTSARWVQCACFFPGLRLTRLAYRSNSVRGLRRWKKVGRKARSC